MNALILAAGYATRLYPLTLNKAKPLLEVGGKPMIGWLMESLRGIEEIETIYIVTNAKFAADFERWAKEFQAANPSFHLKVVNDGTTSDHDKLGAIGDINFVISREELAETDLLVIAGDNLFSDSLREFVAEARSSEAAVALYDVGDIEQVRKYAQVQVDANGLITQFEEKPPKPTTSLIAIALYYYSAPVLSLFTTYIAAGNNPDQPGRFIQWLHTRKSVKAVTISGRWFDVGSKETLAEANETFAAEAGLGQGKRPSSNSIKSK